MNTWPSCIVYQEVHQLGCVCLIKSVLTWCRVMYCITCLTVYNVTDDMLGGLLLFLSMHDNSAKADSSSL